MTAPARPPRYFDLLGGHEEGLPADEEMGFVIDNVASHVRTFPDWMAEDIGMPLQLAVLAHELGRRAVIGVTTPLGTAEVELTPDASGWVLVLGRQRGAEVFRAYLDRPYEEYEFWPAGARPGDAEEGPGRIGKHMMWVSFHASVWPRLRGFANELGGVNFAVDEARLK